MSGHKYQRGNGINTENQNTRIIANDVIPNQKVSTSAILQDFKRLNN